MGQREQLRAKLEAIIIDGKRCIDWGSGAKPASKYVNHTNCEWLHLDKNPSLSYEYTVANIEDPHFTDEADAAFCLEVLEHTLDPQAVIDNIYENLKHGGTLYLSVPFLYPEHGEEDYWRFTQNGLRYMLGLFSEVTIESFNSDIGYWVEATK